MILSYFICQKENYYLIKFEKIDIVNSNFQWQSGWDYFEKKNYDC